LFLQLLCTELRERLQLVGLFETVSWFGLALVVSWFGFVCMNSNFTCQTWLFLRCSVSVSRRWIDARDQSRCCVNWKVLAELRFPFRPLAWQIWVKCWFGDLAVWKVTVVDNRASRLERLISSFGSDYRDQSTLSPTLLDGALLSRRL
jgi:hypothetical protein